MRRKADSINPDLLDCEYMLDTHTNTEYCKFCEEPKGGSTHPQECPVRLRWALRYSQSKLKELQDQFDVLKGEALALEAQIRCTCIQTHAHTCQAVPRPVDMAAPWIGMRFWGELAGNPPEWHEFEVTTLTHALRVRRVDGDGEIPIPRTYWDHGVQIGMFKAKP